VIIIYSHATRRNLFINTDNLFVIPMINKVTIITPPEYEGTILEALGKSGVIHLKEVTDLDFEWLHSSSRKSTDYKEVYQRIHPLYLKFSEQSDNEIKRVTPGPDEYNKFVMNPETEVNTVLEKYEALLFTYNDTIEKQNKELKKIVDEQRARRVKLESVRALEPEELKKCFAVGVVKNDIILRFSEYLQTYPDLLHKAVSIYDEESILFVFGSEENRKWVESLFLIFGVKDIFDVIDTEDILLVLDPKKRKEVIKKYQEELERFEAGGEGFSEELSTRKAQGTLEDDHSNRLKDLEDKNIQQNLMLREELNESIGKIAYMDYMLKILSDDSVPVVRTRILNILQGWVPEDKLSKFKENINEIESKIGMKLYVQLEEASHDDHNIPSSAPKLKPEIMQPAWTLTSLRGWPSTHEINPKYISIFVFSLQFGLMFGDIGQGAIFLLVGLFLSRKYKSGMMSKFGTLFIPMGIFAIIFGIGYDSIFLVEGLIFNHHQPMPNPVTQTTTLMKLVFLIGAVLISTGGILGAINQWKAGHKWGIFGQHGLGLILYISGLYLSAMEFIRTSNFMSTLSYWGFFVLLGGLVLSLLEPIVSAVTDGNFTIEAAGAGVGALLMVFVEGLANLFSYLRIVAFALAHASLANAAHQLGDLMGVLPSLILMNLIAMSFEFMSSGVQSMRLLYYEFMSKFYHGDGIRFDPFKVRNVNS